MLSLRRKRSEIRYLIFRPQGNPTDIEDFGNVVVVGGGIGIAPVYPIARFLHAKKNRITLIAGYRSAGERVLGRQAHLRFRQVHSDDE